MKYFFYLISFVLLFTSCYSFKGISIAPDINTYYIGNFDLSAANAPSDLHVVFAEALRNKIRNESRLKLSDENADVTFEGQVTSYNVTAEAPQEGNTVAFNKLTITVQVKYTNTKNEKESYNKPYSFFRLFASDQDLQSVQDGLIKDIFDQLTENVFNQTFTNW